MSRLAQLALSSGLILLPGSTIIINVEPPGYAYFTPISGGQLPISHTPPGKNKHNVLSGSQGVVQGQQSCQKH
jgi:hypothetical protein